MQLEMGMSTRRYLPPSGTAGLARSFVSGNRRVPRAAAHDDGNDALHGAPSFPRIWLVPAGVKDMDSRCARRRGRMAVGGAMLHEVLRGLRDDPAFMGCVTHWEVVPARAGRYADLPAGVDPRIRDALRGRGIERIYSHQLAAFNAVRAGRNAVIVSPTASGKTLAYNLPVLQTLLEDPDARALYLFPTKALSQDQQSRAERGRLLGGSSRCKVFTYDGDTPSSIRISAREEGRIVITNPDMLHTGILPNHTKWIKVLRRGCASS